MIAGPNVIREPTREIQVRGKYDVVVLGGGPAGIAAAAAAGALGRRTLLVERYGFLGGMGTAAGVTNFCGLHANVHGEIRQVVHGVADELLGAHSPASAASTRRTRSSAAPWRRPTTPRPTRCAADEMLLGRGVAILFHAFACGVVKRRQSGIDALVVETKSGRSAVRGQDLHRLLGRRRSRGPRGRALRGRRRRRQHALSHHDVPPRRRRPGDGRRGLAHRFRR